MTKAFDGTAAGKYGLQRLKSGRCGGLWGKALLAPGFCQNLMAESWFGAAYPAKPRPVSRNWHHLEHMDIIFRCELFCALF